MIGKNHIRLQRVNSTNKFATDMIAKSKPIEGTVISASFQYEGRGQIGRFWESQPEMNISCSTILCPTFLDAPQQFQLNIAISLAVHDFIDHFLPEKTIKIKWPNDLYINNKKIAGILIQNTLLGKEINTSVIGTGININQMIFSSDVPNPTSFALENNGFFDLNECFGWLFRFLSKRYLQLKAGHISKMKVEYLETLFRKEEWAEYIGAEKAKFVGEIIDVDDFGRLVILKENGKEETFGFREVSFVI